MIVTFVRRYGFHDGLFMVAALVFDHLTSKSVLRHSIE
jgi:hypothetical protein